MSRRRSSAILESCASASATMCSMSVDRGAVCPDLERKAGVRRIDLPAALHRGGNMSMMSSSRLEYADPKASQS